MGRVLFFVVLGLVAWVFYKAWVRRSQPGPKVGKTQDQPGLSRKTEEEILACQHCGAYTPLSEGVMLQGRFYCGLEHAKASGERVL